MARTRNLKIGLYHNEVLAQLPFEGRMLFAGLPLIADRAGRLEDRPLRIKATLFPFDDVKVDDLLAGLADRGFIDRYDVEGVAVIQITKFGEHQNPHPREAHSDLPEKPEEREGYRHSSDSREKAMPSRAGSSGSSGPSGSSGSTHTDSEAATPHSEPSVLTFACQGQPQTWTLTSAHVSQWAELYPGIDVLGECRKAFAWLEANSNRRKTSTGMPRFLVNWLNRSVDRRSSGAADRRQTERAFTAAELGDARRVLSNRQGRCPHDPGCASPNVCVAVIIRKWREDRGEAA